MSPHPDNQRGFALGEATGILFGAAAILAFAGFALIVAPYIQLHDAPIPKKLKPYTEQQARGRATYVSMGCAYCHSQQPRDPKQAPDVERGWGRPSVPADYSYDYPHQLGTMRTGPDLLNIGARQPSEAWHLLHLYQPRAVVPESIMPSYPFFFEIEAEAAEGDVVVTVPAPYGPKEGVVVAKPEVIDLVRYLQALDRTYPIELPGAEQDAAEESDP